MRAGHAGQQHVVDRAAERLADRLDALQRHRLAPGDALCAPLGLPFSRVGESSGMSASAATSRSTRRRPARQRACWRDPAAGAPAAPGRARGRRRRARAPWPRARRTAASRRRQASRRHVDPDAAPAPGRVAAAVGDADASPRSARCRRRCNGGCARSARCRRRSPRPGGTARAARSGSSGVAASSPARRCRAARSLSRDRRFRRSRTTWRCSSKSASWTQSAPVASSTTFCRKRSYCSSLASTRAQIAS